MGYHTDFEGAFVLDRPLTPQHKMYLEKFAETRRMLRNANKAATIPDPVRQAVHLPIGIDGEYFVGGTGEMGQKDDPSVIDHNDSPSTQPGLWCQWVPSPDGKTITWDGGEKFYDYIDWIKYLLKDFLIPWGYVLNGIVTWQGEDRNDIGSIVIVNNVVTTKAGKIVYE